MISQYTHLKGVLFMPTFSNQAQLSYNGITANSNIAYGQILEVLAASKTALSDTYASGDRITYIFSIVNSGTTAGRIY